MAGQIYLADTTVWVLRGRDREIHDRFGALVAEGRLAACQMTALEHLNNAPSPKAYEDVWGVLHGVRWIDVTTPALDRALAVHRELGAASLHRNFRLPDLIIAATAELNGATVLHYDSDYDHIAKITGQPTEWVVPRGSL
jgi:predicted nucleic acid-binding protein